MDRATGWRVVKPCIVTGVVVLALALLVGCPAPGTPLLRTAATDSEGSLVADCKNVSSGYRVNEYITSSYLSTWGSAWLEGGTEGASQGFDDATGAMKIGPRIGARSAAALVRARMSEATDGLTFSPTPFCRAYSAQFRQVSRAVKEVLPLTGNRVTVSDEQDGYFETDFVDRRHAAAQWRDRYIIGIESETPDRSVIRIVRILYISRGGGRYNQAVSVGHNEAWIMSRVADKIGN